MPTLITASHWSLIDESQWPAKNFKPRELASKGDGSLKVTYESLVAMQWVREQMDRPLRINSCYRDPLHNARIGGAARSRHKVSDAYDISTRGMNKGQCVQLYELCKAAGFTGFGFYNSFLHVDMGRKRTWGSNRKGFRYDS